MTEGLPCGTACGYCYPTLATQCSGVVLLPLRSCRLVAETRKACRKTLRNTAWHVAAEDGPRYAAALLSSPCAAVILWQRWGRYAAVLLCSPCAAVILWQRWGRLVPGLARRRFCHPGAPLGGGGQRGQCGELQRSSEALHVEQYVALNTDERPS